VEEAGEEAGAAAVEEGEAAEVAEAAGAEEEPVRGAFRAVAELDRRLAA
jgi:hypothetical protein